MVTPFAVEVYDKAFVRRGFASDPESLVVTVRHNLPGTVTMRYPNTHRRVADLAAPGARVVVKYLGTPVLTGMVQLATGSGPSAGGAVEFTAVDDFRLLQRVLGWPVPGSALTAQTVAYDNRSGPAETVLKGVVGANASRLGLPVTVAPDQGRGASVRWSWRFHPLLDRMALDAPGIGVTVVQSGAGFVVDCYTPSTYPRVLSEAGGAITEWSYSSAAPTITRGVIGDQGTETARSFTGFVDTAREAEWGDVVEVFGDARDTNDPTVVAERIAELKAEGAPRAGLSVKLSETQVFKYDPTGTTGVRVGDLITMQVGPGLQVTDVLREATLSWTPREGLAVQPTVGDRSDDPTATLVRAIGRAFRLIRNQGAR